MLTVVAPSHTIRCVRILVSVLAVGTFKNVQESLAAFRKLRGVIRSYAATTQEDPRSRMLLEGNMDVYQWLLMISTHSQRHIPQIRQIKAHASYPRTRK